MPTIRASAGCVTQINYIKVDPRHVDELIGKMRHQLDRVTSRAPGFISSSIHRSYDGNHVVNYVQFASARLLDEVHQSTAFQELFAGYRSLVIEGGPILYDVVEVRERSPEASSAQEQAR
jgi:hypothetical protein